MDALILSTFLLLQLSKVVVLSKVDKYLAQGRHSIRVGLLQYTNQGNEGLLAEGSRERKQRNVDEHSIFREMHSSLWSELLLLEPEPLYLFVVSIWIS